ncbi:MAG: GAF domain-containing protein [Acidobacteriia bacterium]|nr:GAF domain-containing protein [Terriglobia bacterium]
MNRQPILSLNCSPPSPESVPSHQPGEPAAATPLSREPLRFPGDDGGKSLAEMAQRDLRAALQLLAERAQYITGASGAAIALREGAHMICRASAGASAPELGAHLQVNSGLSGESVRTQQILRCDDAETDTRVNRESCRALGIASVVVMPLMREQEVIGVFELFSGKAYAFEERDITALQRIAEMIQTAVEQVEAVKQAQEHITGQDEEDILLSDHEPQLVPVELPRLDESPVPPTEITEPALQPTLLEPPPAEVAPPPVVLLGEPGSIHKCAACGFPVSQGRTLCLDCEAAKTADGEIEAAPTQQEAPGFLSDYASAQDQRGWWLSGKYWIGALLLAGIVAAARHWLH